MLQLGARGKLIALHFAFVILTVSPRPGWVIGTGVGFWIFSSKNTPLTASARHSSVNAKPVGDVVYSTLQS